MNAGVQTVNFMMNFVGKKIVKKYVLSDTFSDRNKWFHDKHN